MTELTQTDADNLADAIWWIKGFRAADNNCQLSSQHLDTMHKCRMNVVETLKSSNLVETYRTTKIPYPPGTVVPSQDQGKEGA